MQSSAINHNRFRWAVLTCAVSSCVLGLAACRQPAALPAAATPLTRQIAVTHTSEPVLRPAPGGSPVTFNPKVKATAMSPTPTRQPPGPEKTLQIPASCTPWDDGLAVYFNLSNGYCLLYPERFRVGDVYPWMVNFYGPPLDQSLEPVQAGFSIQARQSASGQTLEQVVTHYIKSEVGDTLPVSRSRITLGGEAAEVIEGLPGRTGNRHVLLIYQDVVYHLVLYPVDNAFPQAKPDVEAIWQAATESFTFLPLTFLDAYATCASGSNAHSAYLNPGAGYCLLYPHGITLQAAAGYAPPIVLSGSLRGPGQSRSVTLAIDAPWPAQGRGLANIVDNALIDVSSADVTGTLTIVGGAPAEVLDGLPGKGRSRHAVVVHEGQVYTLRQAPYGDPALADYQSEAEALWQTVIESLVFVPRAPPPSPEVQVQPSPTAVALETKTPTASTDDLSAGQPPSASEHGVDCGDQTPSLPDTLQIVTADGAQLAFAGEGGGVTLLNLTTDQTQTFSQTLSFAGWSPSGQHLLLGYSEFRYRGNLVVPRQTFWAPPEALPGATDWLALTMADGALLAVSIPGGQCYRVLPPGSLGEGGVGSILWSAAGWLAWTGGLDHLAQTETWTQTLYLQPVAGAEVITRSLSGDIRETYYQLIAWVPGTRLILAAEGMLANSLWSWGVPLVTISADTGEITDLGVSMLLTSEAYAWHPARPGWLALAAGGSRYLFEAGRLALLDVTGGELRYLAGPDIAAFEPAWSADGAWLAYAAVPASPHASGDGRTLESTLDGRAIYVTNPQTGETRQLTHPGEAMDGWPQWSADGSRLLYARRQEGRTDVRVVSLSGDRDELLVAGVAGPERCYYGGCGWEWILAYNAGPLPN
jgi:hypothetical protein